MASEIRRVFTRKEYKIGAKVKYNGQWFTVAAVWPKTDKGYRTRLVRPETRKNIPVKKDPITEQIRPPAKAYQVNHGAKTRWWQFWRR